MSAVILIMLVGGCGYALLRGGAAAAGAAALAAGQDALNTALGLMGGFMFFGGMIRVLEQAGAVRWLVRLLHRPLGLLFGEGLGEEPLSAICMNLSANMLGLGNAATPMGMRAAKLLNPRGDALPGAGLCMLLVINATSVQLLPTSVIALRYAAGSAQPEAIVLPSLIASAAATGTGILLCRLMEKRKA